jgi:hypothetical protein
MGVGVSTGPAVGQRSAIETGSRTVNGGLTSRARRPRPHTLATSPKAPPRMYASAWFSPNALTAISTSPAAGTGSGSSVTVSTSGPP